MEQKSNKRKTAESEKRAHPRDYIDLCRLLWSSFSILFSYLQTFCNVRLYYPDASRTVDSTLHFISTGFVLRFKLNDRHIKSIVCFLLCLRTIDDAFAHHTVQSFEPPINSFPWKHFIRKMFEHIFAQVIKSFDVCEQNHCFHKHFLISIWFLLIFRLCGCGNASNANRPSVPSCLCGHETYYMFR